MRWLYGCGDSMGDHRAIVLIGNTKQAKGDLVETGLTRLAARPCFLHALTTCTHPPMHVHNSPPYTHWIIHTPYTHHRIHYMHYHSHTTHSPPDTLHALSFTHHTLTTGYPTCNIIHTPYTHHRIPHMHHHSHTTHSPPDTPQCQ